jgi:hypothetical protein
MRCRTPSSVALALLLAAAPAGAAEWSGDLAFEAIAFAADPQDPRQSDGAYSVAFEPEWWHDWNDGADRVQVTLFGRWDSVDEARSHYDLRELYWRRAFEGAELRVGVRKVFWGVTESQHLVDVINQTDGVENLDGEDKLGQPMVDLALFRGWGTVDLFVLPMFRERTFASAEGRPRFVPRVEPDLAVWESADEDRHVDYAARWQHTLGAFDLGVAFFSGTARDPLYQLALTPVGEPVLAPVYLQARQWSLDLQSTQGSWLWKLEWLTRDWRLGRYTAATFGFERTVYGVLGGAKDLGLIAEYLFDDRPIGERVTPFEDDLFLGARLAWNDEQSTELLAGVIVDLSDDGMFASVEWSRRLGSAYTLSLEGRAFLDNDPVDFLYALRDDDYLKLELAWYF